ncbi:MAG: DEAD/DEAH box helicase [Fusobacteriaceae bacterium]|nr:DEAD/DEAH box helicase [Fusobacteriaceae bacterium]
MSWTEEQKSVIKCSDSLIVVNACAGSGKTATLMGVMKANPTKKILYIVFNSSMKKEAEEKVKKYEFHHVDIKTSHGLAYKHFGRMNQIGNVSYIDIAEAFSWGASPQRRGYLRTLYSYYKKYLQSAIISIDEFCGKNGEELIQKLKTYIKNASIEEAIKNMKKIWTGMESGEIKMTHDYYLKYFALSTKTEAYYDIVLLDEAQDTNEIMLSIMETKFPKARRIIVGDHNQAIYAWRGAVNAMEFFSKMEGSTKLSLTNSFRVGSSTATLANQVINAKRDLFMEMNGLNQKQILIPKVDKSRPYTYLARTNATLFEYGVNNMNKKLHFNNNVSFKILEEVYELFMGNIKGVEDPRLKMFSSFDSLKFHMDEDGVEETEIKIAVNVVEKYKETTKQHLHQLKSNLSEKEQCDILLSTVHASKGLEYERVILADDFVDIEKINEKINFLENKILSLDNSTEKLKKFKENYNNLFGWFKEECNILYVALTRSFGEMELNKNLSKISIKK